MRYRENDDELERLRERRTAGRKRKNSAGSSYAETGQTGYEAPAGRKRRVLAGQEGRNGEAYGEYGQDYDEDYALDEDYLYGEAGQSGGYAGYEDMDSDRYGRGTSRPQPVSSRTSVPDKRRRTNGERTSNQASGRKAAGSKRRPEQENTRSVQENRGRNGRGGTAPQKQMAKKRKKGRWKALFLILLAAFIGYGAWLFLHRPTGYWNVAVFGVDSRDGGTKKALADVQMICSINRSTGEIRLVSVYRDTYMKIDSDGTYHKINEAYFKGGYEQAVSALEENLDLKIDDYATFNWKSVAEAINILGGIDLEITPAEFGYINAFITETVNSTGIGSVQLSSPGMQHLDGVQAVAYSRLRLMDTDFQRTERQRKVVQLALDKAKQADISTLTSLAAYLVPQISTSVNVNDVLPLVKDIGKYHIGETGGFPFSRQTKRVGKMDCVIPTTLESNVILLHQFLYGEESSYSPSSAVKKISARISEETGLYEEGKSAPSGTSSGGGASSGKNQGGSSGKDEPPVQTESPAAIPDEGTPPESETESTEETTKGADEETETDGTEETSGSEEIGPGVSNEPVKDPDTETEEQGPGVNTGTNSPDKNNNSNETSQKPENGGSGGNSQGAEGPGSGGGSQGAEGPGSGGGSQGAEKPGSGTGGQSPETSGAPGSGTSGPGGPGLTGSQESGPGA